jgi:ubiquinone biosynthesis protein UbiJ
MQNKTHGLVNKELTEHQKMLNLERRIAIVEQEIDKLENDWKELRERVESVLGEWSQK